MEVIIKRPYEAVIIMNPDSSTEEQKALFQKNKGIIEGQFHGTVNHVETWGRRNLANPIDKSRKGLYFFTTFEASPQAIAELERTMRINDKVLRFQHTRLDERISIAKHLEAYRSTLEETANREKEREAKKERTKLARTQQA